MGKEKEKTIEESFSELEGYISKLQDEETPLEEAFEVYKKGMDVLKDCNQMLNEVEKQILILSEEALSDEDAE